ncbi:MAG: GNAT family N-acetyltransferase [Planctomycetales bacterium]
MIEYRTFRNPDPPGLAALWHACRLGRGAIDGLTPEILDALVLSQPYFDPAGLVVAQDEQQIVGFAHAGFAAAADESALNRESGVICAALVHPEHRRRGIGRALVDRAEAYLRERGARDVHAGPSPGRDPFYVGLYGGVRPVGFLETDPDAGPFFEALGYRPVERHGVFERDTAETHDPMHFRLLTIRRNMQLAAAPAPESASWWWFTRLGRLDSACFLLVPKQGGDPVAGITAVGLELYLPKWQVHAAGVTELQVAAEHSRKGYGQALVLEVCRRLRQEAIGRLASHAPESNAAAVSLLQSVGFERVDTGLVYRRADAIR